MMFSFDLVTDPRKKSRLGAMVQPSSSEVVRSTGTFLGPSSEPVVEQTPSA